MKMTYLTPTKPKKNSSLTLLVFIFFGLFLISLFIFPILNPILINISKNSKDFVSSLSLFSYLKSKKALEIENTSLKEKVNSLTSQNANEQALTNQNALLSDKLGIADNKNYILANVIQRPGFSPYDFLVIDEGSTRGITSGSNVFYGNIAIGTVIEASQKSAKVELFSSPGKEFGVLIGDNKLPANAKGIGGGGFEILLPKNLDIKEGGVVVLADNPTKVFGTVSSVSSDPADSFKQIFFTLPINVFEIGDVKVAI